MTEAQMLTHLRGLAVGFAGTRHTHLTDALTLAIEKLTAPRGKGYDYNAYYSRRTERRRAEGLCINCGRPRANNACPVRCGSAPGRKERVAAYNAAKECSHVEDTPRNVSLS